MLHRVSDPIITDPITFANLLVNGIAGFLIKYDHVIALAHGSYAHQAARNVCELAGEALDGAFRYHSHTFLTEIWQ